MLDKFAYPSNSKYMTPPLPDDTDSDAHPRGRSVACDFCRKRKSRCNGGEMPDKQCFNCVTHSVSCTYIDASKNKYSNTYVRDLEDRIAYLEGIFETLSANVGTSRSTTGLKSNQVDERINANVLPGFNTTGSDFGVPAASGSILPSTRLEDSSPDVVKDDTGDPDFVTATWPSKLLGLEIPIFYGKSSSHYFTLDAVHLKKEIEGYTGDHLASDFVFNDPGKKRPEFWVPQPWVIRTLRPPEVKFRFPEQDLLVSLVDLYFNYVNSFLPLLQRPIFEKSLADNLHIRDNDFGATVLLVCAIACRFSEDPRIVHIITPSCASTCWEFFNQVERLRRPLLFPQSIHDLQVFALGAIFLECTVPTASWELLGAGLRLAQEVGAHRRRLYDTKTLVVAESWKRVFWVLLVLDRSISCGLGRPCALQDEDFDVELPFECDDEFWTHADDREAFVQPPGRPSQMAFFLNFIKLQQILAFALRTIYAIKKSRVILGYVGDKWEPRVVAELDSALNRWEGSVPEFLRLNPQCEDHRFFRQSAVLYCCYYQIQILIHAPFIQARRSSPLTTPSFAICMNAARSCVHLLNDSYDRLKPVLYRCLLPLFFSGIILAPKAWNRSKVSADITMRMKEVGNCLDILQAMRERWNAAGRFRDILDMFIRAGAQPSHLLPRSKDLHLYSSKTLFIGPYSAANPLPAEKTPNRNNNTLPAPEQVPDIDDVPVDDDMLNQLPPYLEELFLIERNPCSFEQLCNASQPANLSTVTSLHLPQDAAPSLMPSNDAPGVLRQFMFPNEFIMHSDSITEHGENRYPDSD